MAQKKAKTKKGLPWVEKYRPRQLADISHQEEVVKALQKTIAANNLPHLLFYGPPGTGKTSTILALSREIFGSHMRSRVLELNASHERGINVVRHKVKQFAQMAVGGGSHAGKSLPPFKIVVLDEADSMTRDAQSALRRIMEQFAKVTRFCIICNYVSRIIEPIASRCAKFRFQPLDEDSIAARLDTIAKKEAIHMTPEARAAVFRVSAGDLRKAITVLQTAQRLATPAEGEEAGAVTQELVAEVAGVVPEEALDELWAACTGKGFARLENATRDVLLQGFDLNQVLLALQTRVLAADALTAAAKANVCLRMAEADKRLADGADEELTLMDVTAFIMAQNTAK